MSERVTENVVHLNPAGTGLSPALRRIPPPVLTGNVTEESRSRVESFYSNIAVIFEQWVRRGRSPHTRRSYHESIMSFVRYLGLVWPAQASGLLDVTVADVQNYRDWLMDRGAAPQTLNHRVSTLSSFYRYLALCSAELRLPVMIPNPAHAQFIARVSADPRDETLALPAVRARQLLSLPTGDSVLDHRDRAILRLYLYTGIRLATGCKLQVADFQQDGDQAATLRLLEKGGKRRTIGLHHSAAQAIQKYLACANLNDGPLFRAQRHPRSEALSTTAMNPRTMWSILKRYLLQLPNAVRMREMQGGEKRTESIYTPHSLRATTATLLLDSGVDIMDVKELLGHRYVTTTQIYDKRRRTAREGASHRMPL